MKITTVFFDLGSTLVYSRDPWPPLHKLADQAMIKVLQNSGIAIDQASFITELGGFIQSYYQRHYLNYIEPTSLSALRDILAERGFLDIREDVLRKAMDALYAVTQKNWYLEDDAVETLKVLCNQGYRLGIISNTSDDHNVQQIVDKENLRPYFEHVLTSAALGIRKPDARIFQAALDLFDVSPSTAVMVGDLLEADVLGANQMGIYSIWITRRAQITEEGELAIQPQAVVKALNQIPPLLAEVENDNTDGLD